MSEILRFVKELTNGVWTRRAENPGANSDGDNGGPGRTGHFFDTAAIVTAVKAEQYRDFRTQSSPQGCETFSGALGDVNGV